MSKRHLQSVLVTLVSLVVGFSAEAQLDVNDLRLTNRAQCAIDSESPTQSVFMIIDGFNSGRVGHALARSMGGVPEEVSVQAMREFRFASAGLLQLVVDRLISGSLPLLPLNLEDTVSSRYLPQYASLAKRCAQQNFCPLLKEYVAALWRNKTNDQRGASKRLAQDLFKPVHFLPENLSARSSCLLLKKFSPLQSHLHGTDISAPQLESLAQAVLNSSQYVTNCQEQSLDLDSRNVALQMDIRVNSQAWQAYGYDFWNSVKIYLSYGFRYAPEIQNFAPEFHHIFRSLDFEESALLVPNGCKSITPPKCDSDTLNGNAIRELAKSSGQAPEFEKLVPESTDRELLSKGARGVNNDFLGTLNYESASEWVGQFRKNFVEQRWIMKNKVFNGTHAVTLISEEFDPAELVSFVLPLIQGQVSQEVRDELAYMCLEWRLAGDKQLDFLSSDIDQVAQLNSMIAANSPLGLSIKEQVSYFQNLGPHLGPFCQQLENSKFFQVEEYVTNWAGLENWAKELTSKTMEFPDGIPWTPFSRAEGPFLTFGSERTVLCANAVDCVRKIVKAVVDLHAVAQYAEAFLPTGDQVKSPDLFNPYAELKACKIYDPWYVTKKNRRLFMADLANAALFGWNPVPLYLDMNWTAPHVTSFNKLLSEGKLKFDSNIEKSRLQAALIADFGPYLGTPCAVQVSPGADRGFDFYAFNGISLNYCKANRSSGGVAERPNDVRSSTPRENSYCGGCSLNFVGVSSSAASLEKGSFNPLKFGVYLFRAFYRFAKGMKDKVNVPQTYTLDVNKVAETYLRHGNSIPESCVSALGEGLSCFQDACGSKIADYIEKTYQTKVTGMTVQKTSLSRGSDYGDVRAQFKVSGCSQNFAIEAKCVGRNAKIFRVVRHSLREPSQCRGRLK